MNNIKILDCTLREAPLEQLMWGTASIRKILDGLQKAGIDIIEVGFLKNEAYQVGSTSFQTVEEIKPYLVDKDKNITYVALVDYGRYDIDNLSDYDGESIDAIRVCFKHAEIDKVLAYAQKIRDKGYGVCIQHVDTMGYTDEEITLFIEEVNRFNPLAYSIVDTFGAMYSDELQHYITLVSQKLDKNIMLGLHAHNNLLLADANAQTFVQLLGNERRIIVDVSLYGCGRGAGNAHTELITQYLNRKHKGNYDIDEILDLIDTVINATQKKTNWGYSIPYFISGMYNAHTFNVKHLLKRHNIKSRDLRAIIEKLDEKKKKEYDYQLLDKLYIEYFDRYVDDKDAIDKLKNMFDGRKILFLGPGETVCTQKKDILSFIMQNNPIVIGINNMIDGYKLDFLFYSSSIRYQNLKYQDIEMCVEPQIIVTSNIVNKSKINEIVVNYSSLIQPGWVNVDSSFILAIRLLIRCGIFEVYVAGMDGYREFGNSFYKNELDTNLDKESRDLSTEDNISMLKNIISNYPQFRMYFLTETVYNGVTESK